MKLSLTFILFLFSELVWAEFQWPTFHYAPGMEIIWTADRMVYNGMPMKVENFKCECSVEEILAYYRGRWEKERKKVVENDLGVYLQIGFADRKFFYAIVVRPDSLDFEHAVGRITISEMPNARMKRYVMGNGVPKPADSHIINDVQDAMPGKRSRTILMSNDGTVQENADYYRNYYRSKGWKSYLRPINNEIGAQAISYSLENKDVNIVIHTRDGRSQILFNQVTELR